MMVAILSTSGYDGVVIAPHPAREVRTVFQNLKRWATDIWECVLRFLYKHGVIG